MACHSLGLRLWAAVHVLAWACCAYLAVWLASITLVNLWLQADPRLDASVRFYSNMDSDQWGRSFVRDRARATGYSIGPNGLDECGTGDDLVVAADGRVRFVEESSAIRLWLFFCLLLALASDLLVPAAATVSGELVRSVLASIPISLALGAGTLYFWPFGYYVALSPNVGFPGFNSCSWLGAPPFSAYLMILVVRVRRHWAVSCPEDQRALSEPRSCPGSQAPSADGGLHGSWSLAWLRAPST